MMTTERRNWWASYGVIGAMLAVGALSVGATRGVSAADRSGSSGASRGAQAAAAPAAGDAHAGQTVFHAKCERCHDNTPDAIGPRLANKNVDEAHLRIVIRQGFKTMRAIPVTRLPDASLPNLFAYLRSIHALR